MKIKKIAVILLLGIMLAAACTSPSTTPEPTPEPITADVRVLDKNLNCYEISAGAITCECHVKGTVRNDGDGDARSVVVKAEFFDAYGAKLGDNYTPVGNIDAGESVRYDVRHKEVECPTTCEVWAEWNEPGEEGFCFIATAAYGTEAAAEIDVLRAFRDEVLLESTLGSQLVEWYYQTSPPVADFISENDVLKTLVRELVIDPMVSVATFTQGIWGK